VVSIIVNRVRRRIARQLGAQPGAVRRAAHGCQELSNDALTIATILSILSLNRTMSWAREEVSCVEQDLCDATMRSRALRLRAPGQQESGRRNVWQRANRCETARMRKSWHLARGVANSTSSSSSSRPRPITLSTMAFMRALDAHAARAPGRQELSNNALTHRDNIEHSASQPRPCLGGR
jgi:hypothetical protein